MRNLKKVISSVAAIALVASSASAFALTFPDVDSSASYANAVETMTALNIINGDENGLFNPDNNVTRAEFTKMAVGALGEIAAAEAQTTSQFADAANTSVHWAAGYVAQGVADGFINGYDDTTFGPDDQVTYAQACKMLVAAIGYTTYAEAAGGWPSGYVSQASSLGITKGVSATNDTNLTRAQCAVLIYNAMDVPLCVIDSWETTATLTGTVQTPVLKKLDGKENRDYQTLLTDKHNAYVVKGRVTANAKGNANGLKKDEVSYDVEVSDNFDDTLNITKDSVQGETFKVGETKAADMLFAYTVAIVQKDEDTDEFTILSIVNYGNSKVVEDIPASDVAKDDKTIKTDYVENGKLPVYKTSSSSTTTKYDLAADAKIYVNGVDAGDLTNDKIKDYILNNNTGKITLVDKTNVGSTTTDGKYDYIMVTYYVDAVVDYVQTTASYAKVYFKHQQTGATSMKWDPEDEDIDITFTKDGEAIDYADLNENDVLSIQYDIVHEGTASSSLTDKKYYNVVVSTNVVEGNVSSRDTEDQTITVDGTEYDLVEAMVTAGEFELGTQYQLFVDAFGYVAYYDEGSSDKNYGVVVAMYKGNGDDYPTVRMITSDAKVVAYECKDKAEADKFFNMAKGVTTGYTGSFTKTDIAANIKAGKTVCTYKLSNNKIRFDKQMDVEGGSDLEYRASNKKLEGYSIDEAVTKVIDMDEYMDAANSGNTVSTLSVSSFEDEANYDAILCDKNNDSVYRFVIVFKGTSSIRPETQIAVVKSVDGQGDQDSTKVNRYTVARGGEEVELLVEDGATELKEGAVIAYTVGGDGYVEDGKLFVLYTPAADYDALLSSVLGNDDFAKGVSYVEDVTTSKGLRKAIAYEAGKQSSKDIYAYLGVVYKKTASGFELFTGQTSGKSAVKDTVSFTTGSANVYVFDYNGRANRGDRLSIGNSGTQGDRIYNPAYDTDAKNNVVWDDVTANDVTPQIAFVREVDKTVTDVIFFVAP